MKRMLKKSVSIILLSILIASITLSGCGNTNVPAPGNQGTVATPTPGSNTEQNQDKPASIVDNSKLTKVTVFADIDPTVKETCKDLNDNEAFKELEKRTGVHAEWIHPTEVNQQFTLLIASGQYPDVIMYNWKAAPGGVVKYAQDGVILKLNDLVRDYAPDLSAILEKYPGVHRDLTDANGDIYYLPRLFLHPEANIFKGPLIRRDWLEKLNLEVPTNVNELYEVLKAFRDRDPNGNNKQDEWAMSGGCYADGGGFISTAAFSVGMLSWAWDVHYDFYLKDGQVKFGPIEPAFKEALAFANKLYNEKLLDPDYLVNDRSKLDAKVMNDQVGFLFHYQPTNFLRNMAEKNPEFDLVGIPYLKGLDGQKGDFDSSLIQTMSPDGIAITTSAKYPEEVMKWLNYGYTEEGHKLFNFGIEGESYVMKDGVPTYTDTIMKNPDGLSLGAALSKWTMGVSKWAVAQDIQVFRQYVMTDYSRESIQAWADSVDFDPFERILPAIEKTPEKAERYTAIMTDVKTYVAEMTDKFVFGKESLDKYDEFVNKLKQMNIEEAIQIQQEAYEMYKSK